MLYVATYIHLNNKFDVHLFSFYLIVWISGDWGVRGLGRSLKKGPFGIFVDANIRHSTTCSNKKAASGNLLMRRSMKQ